MVHWFVTNNSHSILIDASIIIVIISALWILSLSELFTKNVYNNYHSNISTNSGSSPFYNVYTTVGNNSKYLYISCSNYGKILFYIFTATYNNAPSPILLLLSLLLCATSANVINCVDKSCDMNAVICDANEDCTINMGFPEWTSCHNPSIQCPSGPFNCDTNLVGHVCHHLVIDGSQMNEGNLTISLKPGSNASDVFIKCPHQGNCNTLFEEDGLMQNPQFASLHSISDQSKPRRLVDATNDWTAATWNSLGNKWFVFEDWVWAQKLDVVLVQEAGDPTFNWTGEPTTTARTMYGVQYGD